MAIPSDNLKTNYLQMKPRNCILILFVSLISPVIFFSCSKNDDADSNPDYKYYVKSLPVGEYNKNTIQTFMLFLDLVYPGAEDLATDVTAGVKIRKLSYKTKLGNKEIQASGLVCLPTTAGSFPVLCFQNGTNTLHANAPSRNPDSDVYRVLECMASLGYIVVIPDYIGFGDSESSFHPYLHAESTVTSILDMLRAVKEYSEAENTQAVPGSDLYIFGYSQGGWATLQLEKTIEQSYASEFHLAASSCGGGPYKQGILSESLIQSDTYPMPYFLAYIIQAYRSLGLFSNPLSDIFNQPYAGKIPGLFDGSRSGDGINAELTTSISALFTDSYRAGYATDPKFSSLRAALTANSVQAWKLTTPTRLYHAGDDTFVSVNMSNYMYQELKAAGVSEANLQLIILPGLDHSEGVIPFGISTMLWFQELRK